MEVLWANRLGFSPCSGQLKSLGQFAITVRPVVLICKLPERNMKLSNYFNIFLRTSWNITSKPVMFRWVVSWLICSKWITMFPLRTEIEYCFTVSFWNQESANLLSALIILFGSWASSLSLPDWSEKPKPGYHATFFTIWSRLPPSPLSIPRPRKVLCMHSLVTQSTFFRCNMAFYKEL